MTSKQIRKMNQFKTALGGGLFLFLLAGCNSSDVSGIAPTINQTTSTTNYPSSGNSCNTKVVDFGLKDGAAVAQRGLFSDVKVNPLTGLPVVAYTDSGVTATPGGNNTIMLSYEVLNASGDATWQSEVVAGDNTQGSGALYLRLAMTSTGIPMVYWTTGASGTTVMMAGRNVAIGSSTSAAWTVGAIDSLAGSAPGAFEVAVNPNNQVGLIYEHLQTAATQQPRFVYCSSNCNVYTNYQGMASATTFIDTPATGDTAVIRAVGMAWCNAGSNIYYPAVTYYGGGANNGRYAICMNSNLANCGQAGNWTTLSTALAVTVTSGDTTKLYIDPSVVGDRPKILVRTAGAATLSTVEINQGCTSAPTTFTTALLPGAVATTANAFATILKDSGQYYHMLFNTGIASMNYQNSSSAGQTGVFAVAANWNAEQTLETTTLAAVGATNGGAALYNGTTPSTNGVLYASYGPVAGYFNLTMATVNGLSGNANSVIAQEYPSENGSIQMPNTGGAAPLVYRNISTATTSTGNPAIAYIDYSNSIGAATASRLKYAYRNGTTNSSDWIVNLVQGPVIPQYPSLVFDAYNTPWIGYLESNLIGGNARYILMNNSRADGTGAWSTYTFPFLNKGALAATPLSDDVALAIYNSGGVSYPVMVVSSSAGTFGIKATYLNPQTGQWYAASPTTVDTIVSGIQKLSIDSDGTNIVIAYYDVASTKIKVASSSNGGITWNGPVLATSSAGYGQGPSVKLSGGIPSVAYWAKSQNNVLYSQCSATSLTACTTSGVPWATVTQVNSGGGNNLGVSTMNAVSDQFLSTSINFDTSGNANVYFPLGFATGLTSGLAVSSGPASQSGSFTQSMLYTAGTGMTSVSPLASSNNYALAGQQVSTARNSITGVPIAAYVGPGNWLYVTSCGD